MAELEQVVDRLRAWEAEGEPPVVDKKIVHKHQQSNVFVSRAERIGEDPDEIIGQLALPADHPFFFEHPLDHFPGLMLIEAGRQFGTTVAHQIYGVPFETAFILNGLRIDFTSFAELGKPVFVNSTVSEKEFKRGMLTSMLYAGNFVQNGEAIGYMAGRWHIYPKKVMARMRRSGFKVRS